MTMSIKGTSAQKNAIVEANGWEGRSMKPTPQVQFALQAIAMTCTKAQTELQRALEELRSGGADAHIAFGHAAAALQYLAELGAAQDLINAMRVSGRG